MPIPPPAPPVQRYDMVTNYRCGESIDELERADDGEWVRFAEVEALLLQCAQEIAELKKYARTMKEVADSNARDCVEAEAQLTARAQEIEQVKAVCEESNAVCICGCPVSEHENYGEDGECCENPEHECLRTSKAVYAIVHRLRADAALVSRAPQVCIACQKGDHQQCLGGRCECIHAEADAALVSRAPQPDMCTCGHERDCHGNDGAGHCGQEPCRRGGCKRFTAVAPAVSRAPQQEQD